MANDTKAGNIALLIDADNASPHALDPVLTVLAELGTVNIRRVYGNWRKQALKTWADLTLKHGIEPHQQFDLTKGKNATDMKMTIDAMDLLYTRRVDGFGIMSSDSDFMPIAMRIRQDGLPVYGFGTSKTPEAFKQACTRFIDVAALGKAGEGAAAAESVPATARENEPRGKHEPIGPDLVKLLIDAYNAAKRDERGYVSLTDLGRRAGNRSSFDARSYGFSRLSELIEAVPNFQAERRDGQTFVKRVR
ncbi:NYN domain-containing protein [Hephaestia sp. GCM10023244]|uniref:NYN domain-containing protein n=1 Tax=unclassified Hephaestia TaxID=2631281 RepID=UPI0020776AA9|nr:NYN domain-containing protein [Hephaestia sp. MAHUQ-44]MCM8731330.1 NYN domain-containing protein [Hephaestia sp. MAHUQ-44]